MRSIPNLGALALTLCVTAAALAQQPAAIHAQHQAEHANQPTNPAFFANTPISDAPVDSTASSNNNAAIAADAAVAAAVTPRRLAAGLRAGRPCRAVFGYLPYWENPTPLRWDLLTHVAAFSVQVNAYGELYNKRGWPWTTLVNEAHDNGVKVILVVTNFDDGSIATLINTPVYKQAFFQAIRTEMINGAADGLNIDFEGGSGWQDDINGFMADLSAYLKAYDPDWEISFAGPAVNWSNRWDLPGLAASCDYIFIMGYAFAGSFSSSTGANAPLDGGSINLIDTLDDEYANVPPEKLILGLPYYGHHWITASDAAKSTILSFVSSTRFTTDEPNAAFYGRLWDSTSHTPWYRWYDGASWHQVWYDDAESLGDKFQLAIDRDMLGVGMWALGYDEGRTELWDQIELQFGGCNLLCDFDADGDCDTADWQRMLFCFGGPGLAYSESHYCRTFDLNNDTHVDLQDFAALQQSWPAP